MGGVFSEERIMQKRKRRFSKTDRTGKWTWRLFGNGRHAETEKCVFWTNGPQDENASIFSRTDRRTKMSGVFSATDRTGKRVLTKLAEIRSTLLVPNRGQEYTIDTSCRFLFLSFLRGHSPFTITAHLVRRLFIRLLLVRTNANVRKNLAGTICVLFSYRF